MVTFVHGVGQSGWHSTVLGGRVAEQLRDFSTRTRKLEPVVGTGRFATRLLTVTTVLLFFSAARSLCVTWDPVSGRTDPGAVWDIMTSLDAGSYVNLVVGSVFAAPWASSVGVGILAWLLFRFETPFYFFDSRWLLRRRTGLLLLIAMGGIATPWALSGPWSWRIGGLISLVLLAGSTKYTLRLSSSASAGQRRARAWHRRFSRELARGWLEAPLAARLRFWLVNRFSRADFPDYGATAPTPGQVTTAFDLTKRLRDEAAQSRDAYRLLRALLKQERDRPVTDALDRRNDDVTDLINEGRAADSMVRLVLLDRKIVLTGDRRRRLRLRLRALRLGFFTWMLNRAGALLVLITIVSGAIVVANPVPWVPEECFTVGAGVPFEGYLLADSGSVLVVLEQLPAAVLNIPTNQVAAIVDGPCR